MAAVVRVQDRLETGLLSEDQKFESQEPHHPLAHTVCSVFPYEAVWALLCTDQFGVTIRNL